MTKTTVRYENKRQWQTYTLKCLGHAGYAKEGEDIVCAAVSTLCYTLYNYIRKLEVEILFKTDEEKGFMYLSVTNYGPMNLKAVYAFEMAQAGLETIAENYPLNVSCEVEVI